MDGSKDNRSVRGGQFIRLLIVIFAGAAGLAAQSFLNPLTTAGMNDRGLHLYSVSVYTGFATVDQSALQALNGRGAVDPPGHSTASGVAASLGLNLGGERSNFSMMYSGSYLYQTYFTSQGTMNHSGALSWGRKLAPKWRVGASVSAAVGTFNQMVFAPNSSQSIAALAGTFEDLSGAVLNGQGTNVDLVSAVTSATATISPQQRLIFGDRLLTANGNSSISYSRSPRLNLSLILDGTRMQHLGGRGDAADPGFYVVPQASSMSLGFSIGYSLSPRTTISGSVNYGRSLSSVNNAQYDSFQVGLGRKLSPRWFVQGSVGGGYILPGEQTYSTRGVQSQLSGSIGYRPHSGHSLMASAFRSIADYYGIATGATLGVSGGWAWRRAGASWGLQAAFDESRLLGSPLKNGGYRVNFGFHRTLMRRTSLTAQYVYASTAGNLLTVNGVLSAPNYTFKQQFVRLSFIWGGVGGGSRGPADKSAVSPAQ